MSFAATFLEPRALEQSTASNLSQAFSVPPSQVWDGNDGAWSSFVIRVGTPAQYFRILPATNSDETWVPIPDQCDRGVGWCGNGRGVAPNNAANSGPSSGSPSGITFTSLDAGSTCMANKSPYCRTCVSIDGKCTTGPCAGRTCCGDTPGQCNSGGCNGIDGLCMAAYIGCPCPGPDYNAAETTATTASVAAANPLNAEGFLANGSTSWTAQGTHWIGSEAFINRTAQGTYGLDTVGVGPDAATGLTVNNIVVAGIPAVPFYLGKLGTKPTNTSGPNQSSQSFMMQLLSQKLIPSNTFGYTAGALYKQQTVFGSLTLGGWDLSRYVPNDVTFQITASNDLFLPLQGITATSTTRANTTLFSDRLNALVDTTNPDSYLPLSVCRAFETAFGLTWDNTTARYLVNDTAHQSLLASNPSITFSFAGFTSNPSSSTGVAPPSKSINITLPYSAFDLQAGVPIFANGTNYFPIRRAANASQYTIGRALFQEAYLRVDYEKSNFSIAQASYPVPNKTNIITINHGSGSSAMSQGGSSILSHGAIAGIAIGASALIILICSIAYYFFRRRSHAKAAAKHQSPIIGYPSAAMSDSSGNEKDTWPSSPSSNQMSSTMGANEGTLIGSAASPTSMRSNPLAGELEDSGSPIKGLKHMYTPQGDYFGFGRSHSTLSKPLPRTPVELAGHEAVDELMEKRWAVGSPRSTRSGSSQMSGDGKSAKNQQARKTKHIYEMMG